MWGKLKPFFLFGLKSKINKILNLSFFAFFYYFSELAHLSPRKVAITILTSRYFSGLYL